MSPVNDCGFRPRSDELSISGIYGMATRKFKHYLQNKLQIKQAVLTKSTCLKRGDLEMGSRGVEPTWSIISQMVLAAPLAVMKSVMKGVP